MLGELIAGHIAAGPARLAVVDGQRVLTYAALDAQANLLAHHLRRHGAGRGRVVAVVLPPSAERVLAALAVLRSGAACAEADPAAPVGFVAAILADARPCLVVTRRGLATRLPAGRWRVLTLDGDAAEIEREPTVPVLGAARASDVASLLYAPPPRIGTRRVELTHAELLDVVRWHHRALTVTPADRALLVSSAGVAAVRDIWPYLAAGASLHVPDDIVCLEPEALRDWVVAQDITIAVATNPIVERLLTLPWPAAKRLRALVTDRIVRYAAPVGASFVGGWEPLAEHVRIVPMPAVHQLARIRHAEPIARRRAIPVAGVDTSRSAA